MAGVKGVESMEDKIKHLHKVTRITSNDPFSWHAIGTTLYNNKSYNESLNYFMKANEIKENFSAANLYYIGDCLRRIGRVNESIKYLEKALSIKAYNKVDKKVIKIYKFFF
uniref:TPR_REGION domain-containing protein n=1 Tax=Parastrongyloides trichosuri TaxID=131310 RepID=A0A0N4ZJ81_PARTI